MRQVPGRAAWLLIGDGRLAGHLSHYFRLEGRPFTGWSRRGPGGEDALPALLAGAERVLLAIRDDALAGFVRRWRRSAGAVWVHFSGSAIVDGAWSAHPLSTFSGPPYAHDVYRAIPFVVEQEGPPLAELLPGLANPTAAIPRAAKPLYHALCVAAGNFTQLLWQELFRSFETRLGLPAGLAVPYLRQTAAGLERLDGGALTGPLARGDRGTIRRNLDALRGAGMDGLAGVYDAFVELARPKPAEVAA